MIYKVEPAAKNLPPFAVVAIDIDGYQSTVGLFYTPEWAGRVNKLLNQDKNLRRRKHHTKR